MPVGTTLTRAFCSSAVTTSGAAGVAMSMSETGLPISVSRTEPPTNLAMTPPAASAARTRRVGASVIQACGAMRTPVAERRIRIKSEVRCRTGLDMARHDLAVDGARRHVVRGVGAPAEAECHEGQHANHEHDPGGGEPGPRQAAQRAGDAGRL